MNTKVFFLLTVVVLIKAFGIQAEEPTTVNEKLLANIENEEIVDGSLLINSENTRIVFLAKEGDKQYMIIKDKRFKKYDYVRNPVFSADGKVLACIVTDKGHDRPVIEGKAGGSYVDIAGSIALSNDGKHHAFVARHENRPTFVVVFDGEYQNFIVDPDRCRLVFSPDGSRLAYNAMKYDDDWGENKHFIVVDGKESSAKYDDIMESSITFSPDSKKVAYAAKTSKTSGDKWKVMVDNEEWTFDLIGGYTGIVFSPDSKRVAFAANLEGKWFTVIDGKAEDKFDDVGKIIFNSDGSRYAYWGKEGDKYYLVDTGVKGTKKADSITGITFSPEGNRLAYCVKSGGKWFAVLDNKKQKSYDNIAFPLLLNPDGTRFAYAAQEGTEWVFVTDGRESKKYQALLSNTFTFSPEGFHLVYGVLKDDVPSFVVDGVECSPRYDVIYNINGGGVRFECDNTFHYIAAKGNDIYLVTEQIK